MEIKFSRHAKKQIKWRKIRKEDIEFAISEPDKLENSIKGRKNAFKVVEGRLLKVTYKYEGDNIIIITAMVKME